VHTFTVWNTPYHRRSCCFHPVTVIFDLRTDLGSVKINQHTKDLGAKGHLDGKLMSGRRHTLSLHVPIALSGPLNLSAISKVNDIKLKLEITSIAESLQNRQDCHLRIPMFILGLLHPVTDQWQIWNSRLELLCACLSNEKPPKNREFDQILNLWGFRIRNVSTEL